jgi:hypothetical protein
MVSLLFNQFTVAVSFLAATTEMATHGLWSECDDFYLAVLAAIAASLTRKP